MRVTDEMVEAALDAIRQHEVHVFGEIKTPPNGARFECMRVALSAALAQQAGAVANDAYEHGWVNASLWAARDDLISDIGSPAYIKARDAVLASSGPGGGGEDGNG